MQKAPFFDQVAKAPPGSEAFWTKTEDGVQIRIGLFPYAGEAAAKGTVLLFPGRTEYIEKYGMAAQDLAARGYVTLAIDWRGQGLADRLLQERQAGHVEEFSDYQHDVAALLKLAKAKGLPEPFYLVGHSMGGCIGLRALIENLPVKAAVFTAPMWGIWLSAPARPIAWALGHFSTSIGQGHRFAPGTNANTYVISAAFKGNTLTTDPAMFDFLRHQLTVHPELSLGGPSIHWLKSALEECKNLSAEPAPQMPCLTFLGSNERIVDSKRVVERMSTWDNGELVLIEGGEHEVMMETPAIRKDVFDQMARHFTAHS